MSSFSWNAMIAALERAIAAAETLGPEGELSDGAHAR